MHFESLDRSSVFPSKINVFLFNSWCRHSENLICSTPTNLANSFAPLSRLQSVPGTLTRRRSGVSESPLADPCKKHESVVNSISFQETTKLPRGHHNQRALDPARRHRETCSHLMRRSMARLMDLCEIHVVVAVMIPNGNEKSHASEARSSPTASSPSQHRT